MNPTPLCKIMGDFGSDKGHSDINSSWHNYTLKYYELFKDIREKKIRIFELGLGTNNTSLPSNMGPNGKPGASLYGWEAFFPNASIYGADIDKNILFNKDRIKTFYCDQTNKLEIEKMWQHKELIENFDIIIEDGLHEFHANVIFFENSIHKIKSGGIYIIEDILNNTLEIWNDKINEWRQKYTSCEFEIVQLSSQRNPFDNTLLIVRVK